MAHSLPRRRIAILALAAGLGLCVVGPAASLAAPTLTQEERGGEAIAAAVRDGETRCADLSTDDFELIGEYAMGRHLGSVALHSTMNVRMDQTMGALGERRMHVALGYRYSGCPGGPTSGWVGPVAGMMARPGTMMGSGGHGNLEISALGGALIAIGSAALGAGAATVLSRRRGKPRQDAPR